MPAVLPWVPTHLVTDEKCAVLLEQLVCRLEVAVVRDHDTSLTLDGLNLQGKKLTKETKLSRGL